MKETLVMTAANNKQLSFATARPTSFLSSLPQSSSFNGLSYRRSITPSLCTTTTQPNYPNHNARKFASATASGKHSKSVVVVGAGAMGLTTAIRLSEAGHNVKIVSQETPSTILSPSRLKTKPKGTYTSSGSGGLWMPFLLNDSRIEKWATATFKEYENAVNADIGVTFHEGFWVSATKDPVLQWYAELTNMRIVQSADDTRIPNEYAGGALLFKTPIVNVNKYLPYLEERAKNLGVSLHLTTDLDNETRGDDKTYGLWDLERVKKFAGNEQTVIVICAGVGAGRLIENEKMVPGRGITVRIERPEGKNYFISEDPTDGLLSRDGLLAYAIPRGDKEYTLGGSIFKGEWKEDASEEEIDGVLTRATKLLQIEKEEVTFTSTWTGLRPMLEDGSARVEVIKENVIANYGQGGSGLTLAWGCADEVVDIVQR